MSEEQNKKIAAYGIDGIIEYLELLIKNSKETVNDNPALTKEALHNGLDTAITYLGMITVPGEVSIDEPESIR